MKKQLTTLLLTLLTITLPAQTESAQASPQLSETSPGNAGMSAERLAKIDAMLEKAIAEDQ
uniref:hypothetical protein n=1 Tax=Pricia sp. TaxID=2268138 RepID=UPI0035938FB8